MGMLTAPSPITPAPTPTAAPPVPDNPPTPYADTIPPEPLHASNISATAAYPTADPGTNHLHRDEANSATNDPVADPVADPGTDPGADPSADQHSSHAADTTPAPTRMVTFNVTGKAGRDSMDHLTDWMERGDIAVVHMQETWLAGTDSYLLDGNFQIIQHGERTVSKNGRAKGGCVTVLGPTLAPHWDGIVRSTFGHRVLPV